ncbi:MAG TPA: ATP-binding protein, partial [Opitutaceae bacterium]
SSEFRRIPEIAERVHARHHQRVRPPTQDPTRRHRVRFIDPDALERDRIARLFAASAPRIDLLLSSSPEVAPATEPPDAVILGPSLNAATMLETLHRLRAEHPELPVIIVATPDRTEVTIAAFKLGAHDYLLTGPTMPGELVFSLQNALKRADVERANSRLTGELATLNRSLARQVADRTRELENEVLVRRAAEERAEEHAARLQALSNRLIRVQEEERGALARELHDQIGQLLTGLRFQLEAARTAAPSPPLGEALDITGGLLRTVRELTLQLRPRVLDDLGLGPALEWQARLFYGQTGIAVELDLALPPGRLAAEIETSAFRLVQEALTNVARHSGAQTALVTATADERTLHVEVSDRGRGFDPATARARHDSLGLAGLAERVRLAGGQFELVSHPGRGTRLHAEFPLVHPPVHP